MNIQALYEICENLGPGSVFHIFRGSHKTGHWRYLEIPPEYDSRPIKGFKVIMETSVIVYL